MLDELLIWLIPIGFGIFLTNYYWHYFIILYILYFVTVRLLERIQVGNLSEKPVLITGCDSGFGHDLALKCIQNGMPVFACCFAEEGEKGLQIEASRIPGGAKLLTTIKMHVNDEESVKKAREIVDQKMGDKYKGLWAVVNNAGIGNLRGWDDWMTPAIYQQFWDVNALGVIRVTHAFKDLIKKARGRIVNVASITAKFPFPGMGPYSVSKYAVTCYSDIIRQELAQFGITVCVLEPGFFKTPQANPNAAKADIDKVWSMVPERVKEEYGEEMHKWTADAMADWLEYKCKPQPELVVDAYFNALTSIFPRCRYQIGYDSTFQFTPFSYLPTRWSDWMVRLYFQFVAKLPKTAKTY